MNQPFGANSLRNGPDGRGRFGEFGGRFVAETLMPLILEVEQAYHAARADPAFQTELDAYLKHYVGRPSPLWFAERLTRHLGGAKVYFKRDELNHTGSHKANNCMGQILLARRMGKTRIIAETGAGQHGVATATMCALFGLPCTVYMGATDVERQKPNVFRMKLLGAEVKPVTSGASTLKDAMNEALRDWVANVEDTYYLIGTVAGPHPYPMMVRDFQSVIGEEAKAQLQEAEGRLPDAAVACIGGGSNAMGLFHPFLDDPSVRLIGVEAGGHGIETGEHAASLTGGRPGVLHGNRTYLLQDDDGQIIEAHSISAGLDYPGIGPEHSWLHDIGRVEYVSATDQEALAAFQLCTRTEGIIPALEPAHALAHVTKLAPTMGKDQIILMNLCGRGDKDIFAVAEHLGVKLRLHEPHRHPLRRAETRRPRRADPVRRGVGSRTPPPRWRCCAACPAAGADLIEIGMPFTDPMADGPIIQAAGKRALEGRREGRARAGHGARVPPRRRRDADRPDGLSQSDPVLWPRTLLRRCRGGRRGRADHRRSADRGSRPAAARRAARTAWTSSAWSRRPPTTSGCRSCSTGSSGFVYYVSITGITGTRSATSEHLAAAIPRIRQRHRPADRGRLRRAQPGTGGGGVARCRCRGGGLGVDRHARGESGRTWPREARTRCARCWTRCANWPPACAAHGCTHELAHRIRPPEDPHAVHPARGAGQSLAPMPGLPADDLPPRPDREPEGLPALRPSHARRRRRAPRAGPSTMAASPASNCRRCRSIRCGSATASATPTAEGSAREDAPG